VPRGRSRRGDLRLELRGLPPGCSADSLVAWWPADGDLGDVAGGHNATTGVRVPFVAGVHDRAFVFDDSCPAGLRVAEDHAFRNLGAFTIEAWIRPVYDTSPRINVLDGIFGRAVGCDRIGMSFSLTVYKTSSEATICFYMADSTSHEIEAYGPSTTIPRDDDFHHVAATYDGRSMAIFIDGRLARTMANPNARFPAAGNLRIGHHPECSSLTYTAIDELRFFRRALEASEVASIHASRTQAAAARAP
jgi:hypothetical protein